MRGIIALRRVVVAASLGVALFAGQPAMAGSVTREDFSFPGEGGLKVAVFRPDVHVGSLKVGGVDEANADWTEAARTNLQAALRNSPEFKDADITFVDEMAGGDAELLNEYRGMFELVSGAMFTHVTLGAALPTKQITLPATDPVSNPKPRKITKIDWTLGEGAARLKETTGADYAMFLFTRDSYGDAGRKVAQVFAAALFGVWMPAGVHTGYAGLVNLETGDVVWFNTDLAMGGDVREADGAEKRVRQLLRGFPSRDAVEVK